MLYQLHILIFAQFLLVIYILNTHCCGVSVSVWLCIWPSVCLCTCLSAYRSLPVCTHSTPYVQVNAIVARNHFELETVELRQAEIAQQCTDLQVLLKTKRRDLTFALEMHQFLRQANTVSRLDVLYWHTCQCSAVMPRDSYLHFPCHSVCAVIC